MHVFNQYIQQKLERCNVLFIAWDVYKQGDSLKVGERRRRGTGGRSYQVGPQTPVPKDWHDFLRSEKNKEGLFFFLAASMAAFLYAVGKRVYTSSGDKTLHSIGVEDSNVDGGDLFGICNHEEADTRMILYAASAITREASSIEIRSVDSDAVIIALSIFSALLAINENANV